MSKQRRNNKEAQEFIARLKAEPGFYQEYYEAIPERLLKHFDPDKQTEATLQAIKDQLPELESGLKQVLSEIRGVKVEVYLRVKSRTVTSNKIFENLEVFFGITKGTERYIARDIEELNTYLDSLKERGKKPSKITAVAGHFIDMMLLKPEQRIDPQVDMFSGAEKTPQNSPIKPDNLKLDIGVEYIDEKGLGIDLSSGEHKLVSVLQDLLHESIERNPDEKEKERGIPELGVEEVRVNTINIYNSDTDPYQLPAPRLSFTLYEIAKRYKGGKLGGKDQAEVEAIINKLDRTRVTVVYKFEYTSSGKRHEVTTRYRDTILKKINIEAKETIEETGEVIKTKEILARLNPVFIHQIDTKKILRPAGIGAKLSDAKKRVLGKADLSSVDWDLYNELIRARSGRQKKDSEGNKVYEIYEVNLLEKVAKQYYNNKHKKTGEAKKRLAEAIETLKEEGLILQVEIVKDKYLFTLNNDYLKES